MDGYQKVTTKGNMLSAKYIGVIKLRLEKELSIREIADRLQMSHDTVYKRIDDAVKEWPFLQDELNKISEKKIKHIKSKQIR